MEKLGKCECSGVYSISSNWAGSFYTRGRFFQSLGAMAANTKSSLFDSNSSMARTARLYDMSDLAFVVGNKHAGNGLDLQKFTSNSICFSIGLPK